MSPLHLKLGLMKTFVKPTVKRNSSRFHLVICVTSFLISGMIKLKKEIVGRQLFTGFDRSEFQVKNVQLRLQLSNNLGRQARCQGFWKESIIVSSARCCLVVIQPRFLEESLVQSSCRSFISSTIKTRSLLFICSTCFLIIRNKFKNIIQGKLSGHVSFRFR